MAGTLELRMHPGMHHGWLEAPLSLLSELGIEDLVSEHSRCKDGKVYLEVDCSSPLRTRIPNSLRTGHGD